jgi:formylglycine-generating enzyme required for sulfatase activity
MRVRTLLTTALLGTAVVMSVAQPAAPAASATAAAGTPLRDCDVCPWMVPLPAGHFMMGTDDGELELDPNEQPRHSVRLRSFAIGQFEITFAQWDACVAAHACRPIDTDEGWGRDQRPVIHAEWDDAQAYVRWLGKRTGHHYRLPSEAEWEYAARAGTTTPFGLGERIEPSQANFAGGFTYNGSHRGVDRQKTLPVGSFPPNAWGLHDMHGNALEWVQDCWHADYEGAPPDGRAWMKGCSDTRHILRSGSWYDSPRYARSAFRGSIAPGNGFALGFRVARDR